MRSRAARRAEALLSDLGETLAKADEGLADARRAFAKIIAANGGVCPLCHGRDGKHGYPEPYSLCSVGWFLREHPAPSSGAIDSAA